MSNFVVYSESGEIHYRVGGSVAGVPEGLCTLACPSDCEEALHYVDLSGPDPTLKRKSPLASRYHAAGLSVTFPSLPPETLLRIEELELVSDDEPTVIEFDAPGTYEIRLYPPPQHTDEVVEVTVG